MNTQTVVWGWMSFSAFVSCSSISTSSIVDSQLKVIVLEKSEILTFSLSDSFLRPLLVVSLRITTESTFTPLVLSPPYYTVLKTPRLRLKVTNPHGFSFVHVLLGVLFLHSGSSFRYWVSTLQFSQCVDELRRTFQFIPIIIRLRRFNGHKSTYSLV